MKTILLSGIGAVLLTGLLVAFRPPIYMAGSKPAAVQPKNIIYILADDHRYDFMGFTGKVAELKTPNLDRLANEGAHIRNAFVGTALCSPSRASILTGQYAHTHKVVDNFAPLTPGLKFFPQYLKQAGYKTAAIPTMEN
jgi:arylsulfatase A-like enzyme